MTAVVTPSIDEDIWEDVWDEERSWREEHTTAEQAPPPLALVIFGATGDLTHRKLVPALYSLCTAGLLPEKMAIVGFGRSDRSDDRFRDGLRRAVEESSARVSERDWDTFARRITYVRGGYDEPESFEQLARDLDRIDAEAGTENHRLFYLATPPNVYSDVVGCLGAAGLNKPSAEGGWVRLIVEKPFGRDLETARQLDRCVHAVFDESQVYRIDHYLGKETVQNMFVLRFVNGIFEPIWNRNYVDHVQITAAATTTRPAPCAICCRVTSCSSSRLRPWRHRARSRQGKCATRRSRSSTLWAFPIPTILLRAWSVDNMRAAWSMDAGRRGIRTSRTCRRARPRKPSLRSS